MIRKFNFPPKLLCLIEYLHEVVGFGSDGKVDVPILRKLCAEMESEYDAAQTRILSHQPIKNVCGWYPEMSSASALLERLGAVIRE